MLFYVKLRLDTLMCLMLLVTLRHSLEDEEYYGF